MVVSPSRQRVPVPSNWSEQSQCSLLFALESISTFLKSPNHCFSAAAFFGDGRGNVCVWQSHRDAHQSGLRPIVHRAAADLLLYRCLLFLSCFSSVAGPRVD